MESLKAPAALSFDGNVSENWKRFRRNFEMFMLATGSDKKTPEVQAAIFFNVAGEDALERYELWERPEGDRKDLKNVLAAFEEYCAPKSNESVDRHVFFARKQEQGETFEEFVSALRKLSGTCNFGELKDSLIRDQIIAGSIDRSLKERLLRESSLTLEQCIRMCRSTEVAEKNIKTMDDEVKVEIIQKRKNRAFKQNANFNRVRNQLQSVCGKCGLVHAKNRCPAYNKICVRCKKHNHYARMCKTNTPVHAVENEVNEVSNSNEFVIDTIGSGCNQNREWVEKLKVNVSKYLYVKLDTGAQCNVLPYDKFCQLKLKNSLCNSNACLSNYNGSEIKVMGKCTLLCETVRGAKSNVEFQVVECEKGILPVLGLPTLLDLALVTRIESLNKRQVSKSSYDKVMKEYSSVFQGLGCIEGQPYEIKLKPDAVGKVDPCRKVPLGLMEPLKNELNRMVLEGVIRKVDEPTDFVNSLVLVTKRNGSLRVCLDPQHLNKCIRREHYYLPTFEDIASRMVGATVFSTLDANKAFWQLKLTENCSNLTTFNTPYGRYCFLRLPYGICSAPEAFHRAFTECFSDIEGVAIYIDDIIIWGKDQEEHDKRLKLVLERAKAKNVKFNLQKCKFGVNEVKYLGHTFSDKGLKVDGQKIEAILSMKPPTSKKELERFLGMITYVAKFIPNVSELTSVLRNLLKKDIEWIWDSSHNKTFEELKKVLTEAPVLQYYDPNKPIVVSVDSSKDGLGAVLLQNNLPVAYASKALNETQKGYAQIEKEALAVVFGCEKFHHYLFGKDFVVESDHKPLESIFKKPLDKSPARLQRMRIRLQPYSFTLVYRPGKELLLSDALSRAYLDNNADFFEGEIETYVNMITENIEITSDTLKTFQLETENDQGMKILQDLILNGWPDQKQDVPEIAKPYFNFREELSVANKLILKNSCILVPPQLRRSMLSKIHYCHLGLEKSKQKAREIFFWPGMSRDIEELIRKCQTCLNLQKSNSKEPLKPKEVPHGPWEVLGADLFYLAGKHYLIVIDYFSKFVEVIKLGELSSGCTIDMLKSTFSRFGIPKILYTDNGPQFGCKNFKRFSKDWNFTHQTSSPRYPASNGMAERHLQTVKSIMKKAADSGKDFNLALLEYRNTPIDKEIVSPAEILLGRKISGIFPIRRDFFQEEYNKYSNTRQKLLDRQKIQKYYYDRSARHLQPLTRQQPVIINDQMTRHRAQVLGEANRPRSYRLLREDGRVVERNRRHILRGNNFQQRRNYGDMEPAQENTVDQHTLEDSNAEGDRGNCVFTRAGRKVKRPAYFKDYV